MSYRLANRTSTALLARLALLLILLCAAEVASPHPAPFSYVDLFLDAERTHGALVIHDFDAAHELGIQTPEVLLDRAVAGAHRGALVALLGSRMRMHTNDGPLVAAWGDLEVLPERQSLRFAFELDGPVRGKLDLDARLFPYDPNHQTFVNIYERGTLELQAILDARRQVLTFYTGNMQGRWSVVSTFVKAGIHHILIGPDHVLFLFGLMLLGGSWWRLAAIVTAFTIGHSITLSLAALEIVNLPSRLVEPAIALSIIVVGVDNLLVSRQRPSVLGTGEAAGARDLRPWLAGVFGLVHGFGFAAVLIELGLPREALGWSLAAFNLGVEVGQLGIVLALLALGRLAVRLPVYRNAYGERFLTLASVAVIAAGVYWLAQRIGFAPAA